MTQQRSYAERAAATQWAKNHPIRDSTRQAIFHALCRLIDNNQVFYWSVLRLHWRTGFAQSTITSVLAEFVARGLLEPTRERRGKGGTRVYRLIYWRSVDAYPDSLTWEEFKARADSERVEKEARGREKPHRDSENFDSAELRRQRGKFDAAPLHPARVQDTSNFADLDNEVDRIAARASPDQRTELNRRVPETSPAGGDKGLEEIPEDSEEDFEDAHWRWPSPFSVPENRPLPNACETPEGAAQESAPKGTTFEEPVGDPRLPARHTAQRRR